jgi:hypothetical protein
MTHDPQIDDLVFQEFPQKYFSDISRIFHESPAATTDMHVLPGLATVIHEISGTRPGEATPQRA